jgi:hypothetical protein
MSASFVQALDVEQQQGTAPSREGRRAFGLGIVAGALACAVVAALALLHETRSGAGMPYSAVAEVNAVAEPTGARRSEWENAARYRAGELNEAQLGLANLKDGIKDPALMSEVAQWLRHPEGRQMLIKTMANPEFQNQAKSVAEQLKKDGVLPNLFQFDYYADKHVQSTKTQAVLTQALEAASAFHVPGAAKAAGTPSAKAARSSDAQMETLDDLKKVASAAFPFGYFDPLKLSEKEFWGQSNEATIGFLRHAEIKHGRIAMAGFVGYCLHENGIHFPWKPFNDPAYAGLSAPALWDSLPSVARLQIILTIGLFEFWSETSYVLEKEGEKHYMRGGKPGYFPSFSEIPHPVPLNLYDPFGFAKAMS